MSHADRTRLWKLARAPLFAWVALCALLIGTVAFAYVPLGPGNIAVGLFIATLKAAIIAMLFMELRSASGLVRLAAILGLVFLFFLLFLVSTDYLTRA
jgi:cytochrome c oxidase subunit 4